ncbi:ornithine cyclodeaminase family protein [Streptomyces pseudoechinosporeus]
MTSTPATGAPAAGAGAGITLHNGSAVEVPLLPSTEHNAATEITGRSLLHVREEQTAAAVDDDLALEAARAAFLDSVTGAAPDSLVTHGSDPRNRYTVKPAASTTHAGVKIGTYWPGNDQYGLPRHHSTLLLLDQRIGRIAAVLEVGAANAYRTAAADALAVQTLARADSQVLAVFGTGHQALHEARAVSRVRPIRQVLVVGRSEQRAAAMAGTLRGMGLDAAPAEARDACAAADVVVTATTSTVDDAPLFATEWIRPGTHVSCMGADAPGKRELPPPLLARATLFCDLPQQSRRLGELQHAPADAPVTALGDVLTGHAPGRTSPHDITVFDSSGIGLQDLHLGLALLECLGVSL